MTLPRLLVIGAGNEFRRDDAAGLAAARRLASEAAIDVREARGDLSGLADLWEGRSRVVIVDAARSGAEAGTVHRFDASAEPLPAAFSRGSTHALGVAEAVELARVLGALPSELVVYGIEGADFAAGEGMTDPVTAAVEQVASRIVEEALRA